MSGRVDLHCHLLPALDDGPQDEAAAIALAWALVDDGVSTVAATPHRTQRLATPTFELHARLAGLRELLVQQQVPLTVLSGSEIAVDALLDMKSDEIQALRLGGTGPILVELPQRDVPGDPTWIVRDVLERGVPVLLAHPERIPLLQRDLSPLRDLVERGATTQVTSGALLGRYGRTALETAVAMLDAGLVSILASDAHHHELRPPEFTAVRAWLAEHRPGADFERLTVHTPQDLIPPSDTP